MGPSVTRRIVSIPSDGVELEGAFEAPVSPQGLVVFAHGSGSSRMSPRNRSVALALQRAGFATLLFDLLTEKEDAEGHHRFDVPLLAERLQSAVRWANAYPPAANLPLGLFGASTGAAAALEVAAILGSRVAAVVSRGGRPDLASADALSKVVAPTLLIVGGHDTEVIDLNEAAYELLDCVKSLSIVSGASHLFEESGTLEQAAGLAADWFDRHLTRRPHGMEAVAFHGGMTGA